MSASVSMYDHVRSDGESCQAGVYRVVGTEEPVTLLRVADADGRRITTGETVRVSSEEVSSLTPTENPNGNRSIVDQVSSWVRIAPWSLRSFFLRLSWHPAKTAVAVAAILIGLFGEGVVPLPEDAFTVLIGGGALGLSVLGSVWYNH